MSRRSIPIRVLLFAGHREALGRRELTVHVDEGSTVEEVYARLAADHAGLQALRDYTTFAVNQEVVAPNSRLESGDELAFLQPLSGG